MMCTASHTPTGMNLENQCGGHLPHGRQLVTVEQIAEQQPAPHLLDELQIGRHPGNGRPTGTRTIAYT
jgi:hypothetical protein